MVDIFPGGVRDTQARRAFILIGMDTVTAIALVDGAQLWLRKGVGRPVAATLNQLVTLAHDRDALFLNIIDAATGNHIKRIGNFGLPEWVAKEDNQQNALRVEAVETSTGLKLLWSIRRLYRGGASPPAGTGEQSRAETTGGILIDLKSGLVSPFTNGKQIQNEESDKFEPPNLGSHAHDVPDAIAIGRAGEQLLALRTKAQSHDRSQIILEARDADNGVILWETPLAGSETMSKGPPPLRK